MERQMLMYRAASFWTSTYAPELSMGMKTEYEAIDIVDIPYEDVSTKANKQTISMYDDAEQQVTQTETPPAEYKAETPAKEEAPAAEQSAATIPPSTQFEAKF